MPKKVFLLDGWLLVQITPTMSLYWVLIYLISSPYSFLHSHNHGQYHLESNNITRDSDVLIIQLFSYENLGNHGMIKRICWSAVNILHYCQSYFIIGYRHMNMFIPECNCCLILYHTRAIDITRLLLSTSILHTRITLLEYFLLFLWTSLTATGILDDVITILLDVSSLGCYSNNSCWL